MHICTSTYGRNLNLNSKICWEKIFQLIYLKWCEKGEVAIATRYGLDGPGIESRSGRDFPRPSRPALGPTQYNGYWNSFPGGKRRVLGVDHTPPSNNEVKQRVELHVSLLLFRAFMAFCGVNFTLRQERFYFPKTVFRRLRIIAKGCNYFRHVRSFVCLHETTCLPLDGFPRNFKLIFFSKICRENSSFIQL